MGKVIIHFDDVDIDEAIEYVRAVIEQGKISADGESYAYATTFRGMDKVCVTTNKPNENGTVRFNVYKLAEEGE